MKNPLWLLHQNTIQNDDCDKSNNTRRFIPIKSATTENHYNDEDDWLTDWLRTTTTKTRRALPTQKKVIIHLCHAFSSGYFLFSIRRLVTPSGM